MSNSIFDRTPFKAAPLQNDPGEVVEWWESRRWTFNKVVGCTGVITCIATFCCGVISEPIVGEAYGLPDPPILLVFAPFGIILFGIGANVIYTVGWVCEILLGWVFRGTNIAAFRTKAFRFGLGFSVFVTLSPALVCWLLFLVAFLTGQKPPT